MTVAYDELSDGQLVTLMMQGERDALGALYDRYGKAVFGFTYYLLRDPDRAQEVTQEVFLNAWLKAGSYRPERGSFQTWLMTAAHNRAVDELRRNSRQQNTLEQAGWDALLSAGTPEDSPAKGAQRAEEGEAVRKALKRLPPEQGKVIEMAYYQGFSQSEIAKRLQQPLGTVKTRMRLAMHKLRAALATYQEPQ